jgi:O-antigen ligase
MSKFNNTKRILARGKQPLGIRTAEPSGTISFAVPAPPVERTPPAAAGESRLIGFGFILFAVLMISGYLNDWSGWVLGTKAYVSTILWVALPVVWLVSGSALKGFQDRIGLYWAVFVGLMLLGVPFSLWHSRSLIAIVIYVNQALMMYFFMVTFVSTQRRLRAMMTLNAACAGMLLLTCFVFGRADSEGYGRFRIPGSNFFANSNDLALQLVFGITTFIILYYRGGIWRYVLASAGITLSLIYVLKTGSRGCLLSVVLLYAAMIVVANRRILLILLAIPVIGLGIVATESSLLHRLTTLFSSATVTLEDESVIRSARERQELLKKSILMTLQHPLLGVGVQQFPVAAAGESGRNEPWLGTHNSYTEISSECGIPAFCCYIAIIGLSFRRTFRMYRAASRKPQFREIEAMALCIMAGLFVYVIATFFSHVAYTGFLPILAGETVALENIAGPLLFRRSVADLSVPVYA